MPSVQLNDDDLLLIVDVQNDFCPGGALAVPDGDKVVPVVNRLARHFPHVIQTQDWHPPRHSSFAAVHEDKEPFQTVPMPYGEQTLWPDHCVQDTKGAEFHPDLMVKSELIIRKGFRRKIDSYSAFYENDGTTPTGLRGYLLERRFKRIFIVGLATDFCVKWTALDAKKLGFKTCVIEEGVRGIDLDGSVNAAWQEMEQAGITRVSEHDLEV